VSGASVGFGGFVGFGPPGSGIEPTKPATYAWAASGCIGETLLECDEAEREPREEMGDI